MKSRDKRSPSLLNTLWGVVRPVSRRLEGEWKRARKRVYEAVRERQFDQIEPRTGQLQEIVERIPVKRPERYDRMTEVGELFQELAGSNLAAERLFRRAAEEGALHLGEDHLSSIRSRNSLGLLLLQQRRYEEAEALYQGLLRLVESRCGEESSETAVCLENLAAALRGLERGEEAGPIRARATEIRKAIARAV